MKKYYQSIIKLLRSLLYDPISYNSVEINSCKWLNDYVTRLAVRRL